jgi:hypothetical protein
MTYPLTFYVKFLPPNVGGRANGPVIRILEKYRNDKGIYEHELVHVKHWFCSLGLFPFFYLLIPKVRLWAEVQAYREQLQYYADDRSWQFAGFIANKYGLKITQYDAHALLLKH